MRRGFMRGSIFMIGMGGGLGGRRMKAQVEARE